MTDLDRRTVLRGVALTGAIGAVGPLLAACGADEPEAENGSASSPTEEASPTEESGGGGALGPTSDVPVGGGAVFKDEKVVVTQPTKGEFLAFTAVCTHQGCTVGEVADGTINCPCHGSKYSIEDGSVVNGPATKGLEEMTVSVDGGQITVG